MSRKNSQVYITNFSSRTTEDDLLHEFKRFGKVSEINLKRSYAFVVWLLLVSVKNYVSFQVNKFINRVTMITTMLLKPSEN